MISTLLNTIRVFSFSSKDQIIEFINQNKGLLIAINAEKIVNADKRLVNIINNHIGYADGIGAVWALKQKGFKEAVKIPGCELWLNIVESFYKKKSFYLIGSTEDVISATVNKLKAIYPEMNILGYRNGFIKSTQEKKVLLTKIKALKPDIVFVAMGSPKQEYLMEEMYAIHPAIYQGLGGSFDVYIGNISRAPKFLQKLGLEWTFRLIKEPKRIFRQWKLVKFLLLFIRKKL